MNAILVAIIAMAAPLLAQAIEPLAIKVTQDAGTNPMILHVRVTNATDRTITLPKFRLPWADRYSLVIVATELSGRDDPLKTVQLVSVPISGEVSIAPGESLTGEVNLTHYAQGIRERVALRPMLVFWWYEFRPDDDSVRSHYNGAVIVSPASTAR